MLRSLICAAALVLGPVMAQAQPSSAPAAAPAATPWKLIYENSQVIYYIDAHAVQASGVSDVASLLEYKIPQVVGGAQVWSIVSHMQLNCSAELLVTTDNTLYALKKGAGPVVATQAANDSWHRPQAGSLGDLIWNRACPKP
jgi:hypothetical protein